MYEENKTPEGEENENLGYIEEIKKLKETTVPKTELEKLKAENKKLLETLLEGGEVPASAEQKVRTASEIREELFKDDSNLNNLQIAKLSIELREAVLREGGEDPFVPQGNKIVAEESDYEAADKVAEALQSCIEYAEGDNEIFTNELMRITADVSPIASRVKGRR